jgi:tetratricopeptide (TPR) repeat protein
MAPPDVPKPVADRHLIPALRYLRAARAANPLVAKAHARLGLYARYATGAEPAAVHLGRAKRLLPTDPDIWYAAGREAFDRGDRGAAAADWKRSLALSPAFLSPILKALSGGNPAAIRPSLLPDDPAVLLAAADALYPDRGDQRDQRRPFLEAAARSADAAPSADPNRLMAAATALAELGLDDRAGATWARAVDVAPDRFLVRSGAAAFLEDRERYEEAIPHLEAARRISPGDAVVRQRLDAAYHGVKLRKAIE